MKIRKLKWTGAIIIGYAFTFLIDFYRVHNLFSVFVFFAYYIMGLAIFKSDEIKIDYRKSVESIF